MEDKTLIARDNKLLARENYIRRERHVVFGIVGLSLVAIIGDDLIRAEGPALLAEGGISAISVFLLYGYFCTLRLRHIETIRYYRRDDTCHPAQR